MKIVAADAERALDSGAHRALDDIPGRILTVRELEKVYEGAGTVSWLASLGRLPRAPKPALGGVSFAVSEGEILGVLGPKTSGKSTLLRCIAGLILPSAGRVTVLGETPSTLSTEVRAQIGIVIRDDRSFNPRLSGRDNLWVFARLQGVPPGEIDARIDDMLRRMALDRSADRPFRFYTPAMRQRLSVARAILGRPKLLLLDEPTRGLPPRKRDVFYRVLTELVEEEGIGVVYATHELQEAQYLCHRVLVLSEGHVVAEGEYLQVERAAEDAFRRVFEAAAEVPA